MSTQRAIWVRRRASARAAMPTVVITDCELRRTATGSDVTVRTRGLIPHAGPLRITVGGVPVVDVRVTPSGVITGTVARPPLIDEVVLDAGRGRRCPAGSSR